MYPAWSIIFFTSVSGLGLGLAAWLVLGLVDLSDFLHLIIAVAFTFGLVGSGLFSSTLHLGHPERAWRALSQWRSSWLSREGVLAVFVLGALGGWFVFTFIFGPPPLGVGVIITFFIMLTVYATSMIYASLKTVACWNNPLTPTCYLMFSACGGAIIFLWMLSLFDQASTRPISLIAMILLIGAWTAKCAWWWNLDNISSKSTVETATGLGSFGKVRSLMPPHTSENYLQKEMGFVVARRHAMKLRIVSVVFGGLVPFSCLIFGHLSTFLLGSAVVFHMIGVFVERWLFFAEAKHIVTLYYGDQDQQVDNKFLA